MKAIEDLKAALAADPHPEVVADGHMVVHKDHEWHVLCDCADDLKTEAREIADAHLIALMHNTLPALIECAEALKEVTELLNERYEAAGAPPHATELAIGDARAALAKLETPPCATS